MAMEGKDYHDSGVKETHTMDSQQTAVTRQPGANSGGKGGKDFEESPLSGHAHVMTDRRVMEELETSAEKGLSSQKATALHQQWGDNILEPPPKPSPWKLLGRQILNAMTMVLLAAMAVSFGTQDWIEAGVIAALVALNVTVGFTQEWKAEKTVAALASVGAPIAQVVRDGKEIDSRVEEVVPGDIIMLTPGSIVPADARLLEGFVSNLETDEALLTGESLPVLKQSEVLEDPHIPLGDRLNMVYAGSQITKGRARAVVVSTGMNTELGKIAEAIERKVKPTETGWKAKWYKVQVALGVKGTTPLQMKLNKLAYLLLAIAILLAIIVVASTGFTDIDNSIATYAVATAVSILPASLIAVVSLTLATASRELAKRNALVRRMDAIEGLSIVTDICSDKTGTLTVGKMVMKKAWVPARLQDPANKDSGKVDISVGQSYEVETGSDPYYPRGIVRYIDNDKPLVTEEVDSSDDSGDSSDDGSGEDVVHPADMENNMANMALCASLCNMATIHKSKEGNWQASGDATEIALQVFAHKLGRGKPHMTHAKRHHHAQAAAASQPPALQRAGSTYSVNEKAVPLDGHYKLVIEHPFDSTVKRMSTAWRFVKNDGTENDKECLVFMKGAVERVLDRCESVGLGNDAIPLDERRKAEIIARMDALAAEGLRVLCLSGKVLHQSPEAVKAIPRDELENGLRFLGLAGIYDPPRPESRGAVLEATQAGITTRMLTGDHPATASAIAKAVAILREDHPKGAVMTGPQFDALSEQEIDALPELPVVIARCAPETKVRMVEALHRRKVWGMTRFAVMTGDGTYDSSAHSVLVLIYLHTGVNDSPALKRADVGVAMGLAGADVAKSVSDIILADDNFASITRAIRKGRGTLMNLSKFLLYLLSGNIAEVLVLVVGLAFLNKDNVSVYPLSPVAALWINTIAAGPPALALGLEPTAKDAMEKSPLYYGRGTTFATLTIMLMIHSLECKHLEKGLFQMDLMDNKLLLWSAFALSLSVFPVLYIPKISDYAFQVLGLKWEWGIVFGMVLVYLVCTELYKMLKRAIIKAEPGGPKVTEKHLPRFETIAP
ncbi:hypothetical protein QFC22_000414 [Naganishia vaughanmartiniae]|uniref:Uncharacterized protein n=1 Tax=Naganishia vaughanmartiniae TaxID=1424756 RepID=A0ACC2XN93_9TREE|nr:hypothetical protein QFC22_000414 [Naganishia vaughanmartiniae]